METNTNVNLAIADKKLFDKFNHKEYGGLDLAYRLLELNLIPLQCYEELKEGVKKYLESKEA